jgi:hypothetical protein
MNGLLLAIGGDYLAVLTRTNFNESMFEPSLNLTCLNSLMARPKGKTLKIQQITRVELGTSLKSRWIVEV